MILTKSRLLFVAALFAVATVVFIADPAIQANAVEPLNLTLRWQEQMYEGGRYHTQWREEKWNPAETAIIVCDMWDSHHCLNAVKRGGELTPRMNEVLKKARDQGVLIIHSPSDCMAAYEDHPARKRAIAVPKADNLPKEIANWCNWLPDEEKDKYPIDQSDGGEDDEPEEHAAWAKELADKGLNPRAPWKKQVDGLTIDSEKDYITDKGVEVWSIQEKHGIKNVILLGVHTNMCVLGRPFGLRRMAENGRNVVLMRDMTDTMYNPRRAPYVSHFTGTDLIVNHVETYVCPTITSGQILGDDQEFRFAGDDRKHLVIVSAEQEYKTADTLPVFAKEFLGHDFRVSYVFADDKDRDQLQGWKAIQAADVLLISVRRRALPKEQLAAVRQHVEAGKPIIGIRTASHAFALRSGEPAEGHAVWPEFDAEVWGGNYSNHHGNTKQAFAQVAKAADHPILIGVPKDEFKTGGSLYITSPLGKDATLLLTGRAEGIEKEEPVAWTNKTKFGGKAFYTSLGHEGDFANPVFQRLLVNGVYWAVGEEIPEQLESGKEKARAWLQKYDPDKAAQLPVDADDYSLHVSPTDKNLKVPADLELDLLMENPEIANPLYINFDERGRLWLVEYRQYPWPAGLKLVSRDKVWRSVYEPKFAPPPPHAEDSPFRGADRITIHEDTNGDGKYDKHKTFLDGLNMCTAALKGRGGVFVMNPPYLLYYADKDNDDIPDDPKPKILLHGFGHEDSHSLANSLRWGPDGWIYGTQGSTVSAQVVRYGDHGKPMPGEKPVHTMGQNLWRYHPEKHVYEVFAEGGGNAFGVEFDSKGRVYSGHNGGDTRGFHYIQGGYYQKNFGKHGSLSNPYAFAYYPAMKHAKVERFTHTFEIYESTELPKRYHGKLFGVAPHLHYVIHSDIFADGSSRQTKDIAKVMDVNLDVEKSNWFCPVDIQTGPDGALYIADWYASGVAHHLSQSDGVTNPELGRLYRLRGKDQKFAQPFDLGKVSSAELVEKYLTHPNRWYRETAVRLLGDRKDKSVLPKLQEMIVKDDPHVLEAFWAAYQIGGLSKELVKETILHKNEHVSRWTVRLLGDAGDAQGFVAELGAMAYANPFIEVKSQLAASAGRFPAEVGVNMLFLLARNDESSAEDVHIPAMIWWSLEKHANERELILERISDPVWWNWDSPIRVSGMTLPQCLMKRWALAGSEEDLNACGKLLALARKQEGGSPEALVKTFVEAFEGRQLPVLPENLATELAKAEGSFATLLGVRSGKAEAIDAAIDAIQNKATPTLEKQQLIAAVGDVAAVPEKAIPALLNVVAGDSPSLSQTALVALQKYSQPEIATKLLAVYAKLPADVQETAQSTLASRGAWSEQLLTVVDNGDLKADALAADTIARLRLHGSNEKLAGLLAKHFPEAAANDEATVQAKIDVFHKILLEQPGNAKQGQEIFTKVASCGKCHKLFDRGGDIGPDLTAYNRSNLRSMLLAVAHPNAEIREGFETLTVLLVDGRVITGFKVSETPDVLVLRGADGQNVVIKKEDIEEMRQSRRSLMPEGLLSSLSDEQLRDLFAYLAATTPPY